jgi:hypothetical protein
VAGAFGRNHEHIQVAARLDLAKVDVEAVGKAIAAPSLRLGSTSALYTPPWVSSGNRIITTSAFLTASATDNTSSPAFLAFSSLRLPGLSPTTTLIPESRRFMAWACPCEPKPKIATVLSLMKPISAS